MKSSASIFAFALATSLATFAGTASADQADKDACVGLEDGDACTRGDGDPGFCQWDDTDPVLTCESVTSSSSSSGGGSDSASSSSGGGSDSSSGGGGSDSSISSSSSSGGGGSNSSSSGSSDDSCDDDSDDTCDDSTDVNIGCSSSGNAPGSFWGLVGVAAALVMGRRRSVRA